MRLHLFYIISFLFLASCTKDKVGILESEPHYTVKYTDWSNTEVTDTLFLDLNDDGTPDLRLQLYDYIAGQTETGVFWNQLASVMSVNDDFSFSFGIEHSQNDFECLKLNDLINDQLTWYENGIAHNFHTNIFTGQYIHVGIWDLFDHDNHIGYRFQTGDSFQYGWINLNTSWSEITVIESAVNITPNESIPTGYKN